MFEMTEEIKEFRRKYLQEYRAKNKDKQREYVAKYWYKKMQEAEAKEKEKK